MANKKQTILILNGRQYDALTGKAIDVSDASIRQPVVRQINDVVRGAQIERTPALAIPVKAPSTPQPLPPAPKVMDVSRTAGHTKPRAAQRASTLVRSSVSKPKPGIKSQTKVSAPTSAVVPVSNAVVTKWPVTQISPARLTRAEQTIKSQAISKFSTASTTETLVSSQQEAAAVKVYASTAMDAMEHQSQQSSDLFARAIEAAESHTYTHVDKKTIDIQARKPAKTVGETVRKRQPAHQHLASVMAASAAVLIIGGFVGLQYKTDLTLRFANAKAGFNASLPSYQPDGYGVGAFKYSVGNVGTTFHSSATGRDYSLNQQTTKWDNQMLLDNFVVLNYGNYQVLQSGDQIVYVYGDNNASWIKGGVWYQLTTNGSLSTTQILNIATSIT